MSGSNGERKDDESIGRGLGVEYKLSMQILKTGLQQYGSPSLGFKCIDETRINRNSATRNINILLVSLDMSLCVPNRAYQNIKPCI